MPLDISQQLLLHPIDLIEKLKRHSIDQLHALYPGKTIVVCDMGVEDIESGDEIEGGYAKDGVLNIDHHAPTKRMEKQISSTNLAIEYVHAQGSVPDTWPVIINHTDADSVLSSLIIRGILLPEDRFGEAAIAADHTGAENSIADLLQAVQQVENLAISVKNLQLLLEGREPDLDIQHLLNQRLRDRQQAQEMIKNGEFRRIGSVFFAILKRKIDGGLLPAMLPEAGFILLFSPLIYDPDRWEVKVRLGQNVAAGTSLHSLGIKEFDPCFGGRWNAGANNRRNADGSSGGTALDPETYARNFSEFLGE